MCMGAGGGKSKARVHLGRRLTLRSMDPGKFCIALEAVWVRSSGVQGALRLQAPGVHVPSDSLPHEEGQTEKDQKENSVSSGSKTWLAWV